MNGKTLKIWGMIFVLAGAVSKSILQNGLLGIGTVSGTELMQLMQDSAGAMTLATVALVLQALETCAVPIFAFTLVEGFAYTADWKKYLVRIVGLAVISEIPYNLAMGHQLIDFSSRNPVFGLALGLILLYLYRYFVGSKAPCVIASIAAIAWSFMLRIEHGIPMLLLIIAFWIFRKNHLIRGFAGAAVAALCTVGSAFYLVSPMSFLIMHKYSGEKGEGSRVVSYLTYPVILLAVALTAMYLI